MFSNMTSAMPFDTIPQIAMNGVRSNTLGQQVALLQNGDQEAGYHEVKFEASWLSSGVYFYRIQAGSLVQTRKLSLIR